MDDNNLDDVIQDDLDKRNRNPKGPVREKISKEAKKHAKAAAKKAAKKARMTMFKPVGATVFSTFLSVFIVIFMLIGIVSFITSMPGLVQESIMNKVLEGKNKVVSLVDGSDYYLNELAKDKDRTAQKEVLKYLDDMGLDPAGFGFAPFYQRNKETDEVDYSAQLGDEVTMDGNGFFSSIDYTNEFAEAVKNNDLIFKYIISNERTYLVDEFDKIGNMPSLFNLMRDMFRTDLKGMIKTGIKGPDDSTITVDRENKMLEISSVNWSEWGAVQTARYNLDTYAGRYGMPLEFLLALHIATMAPDLTDEMITNPNLQTEVEISLEKGDYDIDYEVTYDGKQLPMKRGSQKSYYDMQYIDESKIKVDGEGKAYLDLSNEDIEELKSKVTLNSLQGWLDHIRTLDLTAYDDGEAIVKSTMDAKEAILGDGMFRVIYRLAVANYNSSIEDWTVYFGNVDYVSEGSMSSNKYQSTVPDYLTPDCKFLAVDNSSEYLNAPAKEIKTPSGNVIILSTMYDAPNLNDIYDMAGTDSFFYTGIIHGLNYYLDGHESELKTEQASLGLTCLLSQIDAYLYKQRLSQFTDVQFTRVATQAMDGSWLEDGVQYDLGENKLLRSEGVGQESQLYILLTKEWLDFVKSHGGIKNCSNQQIHDELVKISENINTYFDRINNKDEHITELLNDLYSKLGYNMMEGIGPDDLKVIYDALNNRNDTFEYAFPRITHVIKHWFKDVIFEYEGQSVYQPTSDARRVKVEVDNPRLEVNAILTDGVNYNQTKQPYVVKGDIVTLDGKQVENTGVENLKFGDYRVGDGYRTTKKLFTQGQYYTFDGSPETSKSVYYARELEKLNGTDKKYAKVHVRNGRISVACVYKDEAAARAEFGNAYDFASGTWNLGAQEIQKERQSTILAQKTAKGDGWSVFLAKATKLKESGENVDIYYVVADKSMAYVSVGSTEADIVTKSRDSVERINSFLDAMGVATKRKPISFDNTTATGDVTTLTAFSILEGMHTETAEYIYRDLKEFLIDLGYYSKAEFDYLNTDVLAWFIPEYTPQGTIWRQNTDEDAMYYGVFLYPAAAAEEGDSQETAQTNQNGFEPGLNVIAPGNARVLELREDGIKLEFDGITQPKIGALDKYTMLIDGITVDKSATVKVTDQEGNEGEMTIQEVMDSKGQYSIMAEEVIGQTGTTKIQIIMKNNRGGYVDNVEDYMGPTLEYESNDLIMLDTDLEQTIEMIWQFEGVSDADPNDGDYYTVEYPSTDVPTVGHGVTAATVAIWEELGYTGYISNGQFVQNKIPKEIVDNVSKVTVKNELDALDAKLAANGVTWGGNQKAAWISLYYNGWHDTVESIIVDWGKGDYKSVRTKWLEVCVDKSGTYTKGHQNRRAQEWVLFNTGELLSQEEAWNMCYVTKEY